MQTEDASRRDSLLGLAPRYSITILEKSNEIELLAENYSKLGVISKKHTLDRLHVACASVNAMDAIISFNFNHINRMRTKNLLPHVNQLCGYGNVTICLPMEVIRNEE